MFTKLKNRKLNNKLSNVKLEKCQTLWELDVDLFYPELCQTVCVEEFEKMAC